MTPPRWWSQPFAPEGSAAAEGIANQLGRPSLDPLEILVREAAQNSWDARIGLKPVEFRVSLQRLGARAAVWNELLTPGPAGESIQDLSASLTEDSLMLVVSDRGTAGLGGPMRAGMKAAAGERSDFVQFMRNVGEPRDTALGGGTFGFGKGIFYRLSTPGVIIADSRAGEEPEQRRLMGAGIGNSFFVDEQRFTGRHWWGVVSDDDVPDPLLGDAADAVRDRLGFRPFAGGETGTDIVVIGAMTGLTPDGEVRRVDQVGDHLASAILWHLWPKMVGEDEHRMKFAVDVDGRDVVIPDPASIDELQPFVEALLEIRGGNGRQIQRSTKPIDVGQLSVAVGANAALSEAPVIESARPFDAPVRHIARMRQAELVVDYLEGPEHVNPSLRYGGVFRASEDADRYFAAAEPPTHDAWIEKGLSGTAYGVVSRTRHQIRRHLTERFDGPLATGATERVGLAAFSARLGTLLAPMAMAAADQNTEGGGASSGQGNRSRKPIVRVIDRTHLVDRGEAPFLVTKVRVSELEQEIQLTADAVVKLDGGSAEATAPAHAHKPRILQWAPVTGGAPIPGAGIRLGPGGESEWWVYAQYVPFVVVDIVVRRVL
ncbi:hypothetical protein CLV46_2529 [Diaminobutyricimonas aerilata]|uniref:Uncharacterized protein n=1 Tax=Diaminobutyricimonas aerilata TaxID=1162967 RepID=A0A2M9CM25_9MICO|nr:hypothetical protein [Diaminobutyricimonas aerilata]PJJ72950.1 hypothetical protein CLV46_2529 [Diaminobutyricimonas aerilata]